MRTLLVSIMILILGACCSCPKKETNIGKTASALTASVSETPIVGAVTQTTATIRFRTSSAANVAVEYAANKNFNNSTTTSSVSTASSDDFTGEIGLSGLSSGTMYWHRLIVDGNTVSPTYVQKFQTFPSGSDCVIAVFADVANNQSRNAPQYEKGKLDGAVVALQIGDMDHRNPSSLATARAMHRDTRDPANAHGADFSKHILTKMGVAHVWDDHDYCGQDEDRHCSIRSDAWKAVDEYWPSYPRPNAGAGLWHKFVCGDAEIFMLDLRSQRDDNTDADNADKSMLDGEPLASNGQKQWLKDGLKNSTKTWKIVVSSVTANTSARPASNDHWKGGFLTEATELKNYLTAESIQNVVMVSADIHTGGGADDGTNNAWGVPELTVPHTNLVNGNGQNLGTWSAGVTPGTNGRDGYGLLTVSATSLKLETKDDAGSVRHSITLNP